MAKTKQDTPLTTYFYIILFITGLILTGGSIVVGFPEPINWMSQIGTGLLLIGIGEWINHPLQKSISYEREAEYTFKRFKHRQRKPSGLGNLFEISGLLLTFIGLAEVIRI